MNIFKYWFHQYLINKFHFTNIYSKISKRNCHLNCIRRFYFSKLIRANDLVFFLISHLNRKIRYYCYRFWVYWRCLFFAWQLEPFILPHGVHINYFKAKATLYVPWELYWEYLVSQVCKKKKNKIKNGNHIYRISKSKKWFIWQMITNIQRMYWKRKTWLIFQIDIFDLLQ